MKEGLMHAQVVNVEFTDAETAIKSLEELIPNVKASPGFVAGYWVRTDDSHGTSMAVYDTAEHAAATAPPVGAEMDGVKVTGSQVGQVMGSA
jgi:hypothetical protein